VALKGGGQTKNAPTISVGRSKGKRSVGRHRHRMEDNIKKDFKKIGCEECVYCVLIFQN